MLTIENQSATTSTFTVLIFQNIKSTYYKSKIKWKHDLNNTSAKSQTRIEIRIKCDCSCRVKHNFVLTKSHPVHVRFIKTYKVHNSVKRKSPERSSSTRRIPCDSRGTVFERRRTAATCRSYANERTFSNHRPNRQFVDRSRHRSPPFFPSSLLPATHFPFPRVLRKGGGGRRWSMRRSRNNTKKIKPSG